jgi:PAS domain S-box-containing protein
MASMTPAKRHSLRWRLPLGIVLLIGAVLSVFLWLTFREVTRGAVQTAGARALIVADQISGSLAQTARQRLTEARRTVGTRAILECLRGQSDARCTEAKRTLAALPSNGQQVTELWAADGTRLLTYASPESASDAMPGRGAPKTAAIGVLERRGDLLYAESSVDVRDPDMDASKPESLLGYVTSRRPLAATPAASRELLNRLAGSGGAIKLGNRSGDVWTDLAKPVAAPPIDLSRAGVATYTDTDRQSFLGALTFIPDTPWAIWVEFPVATVTAPARAFLGRMFLIAILCVLVAALLVRVLSARITRPLAELTDLSEAIASGDYARRTTAAGRDEVGRLGQALNVMADRIDAMHRDLEARVEERTREADLYFTLSPDLLSIANTGGQFLRVNPAWTEVLGWSADELTSSPFLDFVHPDDRDATSHEAAALAAGERRARFVNRYRGKDGSYRWLSWRTALDPAGHKLYAAARDITALRQSEVEVQRHVEELDAVNKELEAFSYSVSHDLRAPLRHIVGFAGLLDGTAGARLDDTERRYVSTIMQAAGKMGRLIDDLLSFSRTSRAVLARRRLDVRALVDDVRRELEVAAPGRSVEWVIGALPEVQGDGPLLRVVLVNLLSNALKYTSGVPSARIEVGHQVEPTGEVTIFVRDNGAGFDMAYAHKLFGVFQRLHRAEEFEGTGVGLATVRRIIQRHGGRTWAQGALGAGATFSFSLPA